MTQFDFGEIDPGQTSGAELAELLGDFRDAINSCHKGNARPAYAVSGLLWVDTSAATPILKYFDGVNDRTLFVVESGGGTVEDSNALGGQGGAFYRNASNLNAGTVSHARLPKSTQAQAEAGTDTATVMTPRRVAQAIAALTSSDALTLGGQGAAFYRNASNINAGTVPKAHLPSDQLTPPGQVAFFALVSPPPGWLRANGAALSRAAYSDLFAAIGTTFGVGNGSTTFNLPDLRGEFLRGWDEGRGVDSGRSFGGAQSDQMAAHHHKWYEYSQLSGSRFDVASGNHYVFDSNGNAVQPVDGVGWAAHLYTKQQEAVSGETRPRNVALLPCIKF